MAFNDFNGLREQVSKTVVGQSDVLDKFLIGILAGGHVLVEGVPGLAKTLLVRSIATASGCSFSRIQFTPDLLPTDLVGFLAYSKGGSSQVVKGPVFANFVLADEVNRAPPKVQSSLLEVMQERQATIGKQVFALPRPFFVMATQNPLESLGTYPLPKVQLDRFMFKLVVGYPDAQSETAIMDRNISLNKFEDFGIKPVLSAQKIVELQAASRKVVVPDKVADYIVSLVDATRNPKAYGFSKGKYLDCGVSSRASISLKAAVQARALLDGRKAASAEDARFLAPDVLRHRVAINFEGQAEGVSSDELIKELLQKVK